MNSNIIVAIIMIGMIIAFVTMAIIAVKKGNSGFVSSIKYKQKREEEPEPNNKEQ